MSECAVCDRRFAFRWTDTHGIGACVDCGAPYRIYHYGEDKRRINDKAPECLLRPDWIPILRRYWTEHHRNVDPGAFNFPGSSYEVATQGDFDVLGRWLEEHKSELPADGGVTA